MILRYFPLLLLAALAAAPASAADTAVIKDQANGYVVPAYGEDVQIANVFVRADGSPVFELWYRRAGAFHDDFYDPRKQALLFKDKAIDAGEDDKVRDELIKKAGLERLPPNSFKLSMEGGAAIANKFRDGRTCLWPYNNSIEFTTADGFPAGGSIFMVLDQPKTKKFERDCEDAGGNADLTARYRQSTGEFYPDDAGGVWAVMFESRYAVHFDREGKTSFFKGRSDIVMLRPDGLDRIRNKADDDGAVTSEKQQVFIDQEESIIDDALAAQKD
jgi:hypothetical protein